MAIAPRQIQRAGASAGQVLVWDGTKWVPGEGIEGLRAMVSFQGDIIRELIGLLEQERFRLTPELEEWVRGPR